MLGTVGVSPRQTNAWGGGRARGLGLLLESAETPVRAAAAAVEPASSRSRGVATRRGRQHAHLAATTRAVTAPRRPQAARIVGAHQNKYDPVYRFLPPVISMCFSNLGRCFALLARALCVCVCVRAASIASRRRTACERHHISDLEKCASPPRTMIAGSL